jgi:uncharacterized BrkB/YihY/UPF0761 family membrane protein
MLSGVTRRHKLWHTVRGAIGFFWGSGLSNEVPALSWFLLASLVPLALGITALAAVILGDYAKAQAVAGRLSQVFPHDVHEQVVQLILRTHRDSPVLIAASIAGMLWTSSGAVGVLRRSFSPLGEAQGHSAVSGKLRNLGVAGGVTVLVVIMVLVASAGTGVVRELGVNPLLTRLLVPAASIALTSLICAAVYWVLSEHRTGWRPVLLGGLTGGVLLQLTPTATGYYLRYVAGSTPVELFLMLTGVLITCYLASMALLVGVAVTMRLQLARQARGSSGVMP